MLYYGLCKTKTGILLTMKSGCLLRDDSVNIIYMTASAARAVSITEAWATWQRCYFRNLDVSTFLCSFLYSCRKHS